MAEYPSTWNRDTFPTISSPATGWASSRRSQSQEARTDGQRSAVRGATTGADPPEDDRLDVRERASAACWTRRSAPERRSPHTSVVAVECFISGRTRALKAIGRQPSAVRRCGQLALAFWLAVICREQRRMTELCEIPLERLRSADDSYEEFYYH
ncbi:Imm49 family immunity protein [Streptomyces virginiae]|uniref:Imm49 family immunity protein n=1 Tax=Streptomyces virginiae TaxID=1961 RepID=UPI0037008CAD